MWVATCRSTLIMQVCKGSIAYTKLIYQMTTNLHIMRWMKILQLIKALMIDVGVEKTVDLERVVGEPFCIPAGS